MDCSDGKVTMRLYRAAALLLMPLVVEKVEGMNAHVLTLLLHLVLDVIGSKQFEAIQGRTRTSTKVRSNSLLQMPLAATSSRT